MGKLSVTLLIAFIVALFSAGVFADDQQIYKWVDSQGIVHYSDKAPTKPKPEQNLKQITLPVLPTPDPQAAAEDQARIADINQWYQGIVAQETQQQYNQALAWQESQDQAAENVPDYTQEVSYVTPVYVGYRPFDFEHPHKNSGHDNFMHPPHQGQPISPVFKSSIWDTQPNPFTQQLFKP